jgi:hypothetical protein
MTMTTRRAALKLAALSALSCIARPDTSHAAPASRLDDMDVETYSEMTHALCAEAHAEYAAAWHAVVALDPSFATFQHPVALLDEAAVGLYVTAFDEGLRLGLAAAAA